jgi:TetR/AcrR family transcriptional repressor of nem operon
VARAKIFQDDAALETAMLLFWKNGYEATSMQALEQATSLKRTSLYHAFGNKRALFNKALHLYFETVLAKFLDVIEDAPTAKMAVQAVLDEAIALHFTPSHPGGCMIVLSLTESEQHDAETRDLLNRALAQLRNRLANRFKRAITDGDMPQGTSCGALSDEIVAIVTGMIVMAKGGASKARLKAVAALASGCVPCMNHDR